MSTITEPVSRANNKPEISPAQRPGLCLCELGPLDPSCTCGRDAIARAFAEARAEVAELRATLDQIETLQLACAIGAAVTDARERMGV